MEPILDPRQPNLAQWTELYRSINFLFLVVAFAVTGALSFLLAHAVIPSLIDSHEAPFEINRFRRFLYPIFFISFVFAIFSLARSMSIAVPVLQEIFPRFAI